MSPCRKISNERYLGAKVRARKGVFDRMVQSTQLSHKLRHSLVVQPIVGGVDVDRPPPLFHLTLSSDELKVCDEDWWRVSSRET